jgi:hypothetical protein
VISGVRTVVSYDLDYSNDEVVEAELAFYAQDNTGTSGISASIRRNMSTAHLQGPRLGSTALKAEPKLGTPSYFQGWGPAVDWTDRGVTFQMGQKTSVPAGSYDRVLVIKETPRSEVDAI